jgi:hypothetical protein
MLFPNVLLELTTSHVADGQPHNITVPKKSTATSKTKTKVANPRPNCILSWGSCRCAVVYLAHSQYDFEWGSKYNRQQHATGWATGSCRAAIGSIRTTQRKHARRSSGPP